MAKFQSITQLAPDRNSLCPCGSGRKFKKCCLGRYQEGYKSDIIHLIKKEQFADALRACRRHLCWYILSHRAHTAPLLKAGNKKELKLLEIDINALGELTELLLYCHHKAGVAEDFPKVLENLNDAIEDSRWRDKIIYFEALWWYLEKDDRELAFAHFSRVKIADCEDPELLALYLDIGDGRLSLVETFSIIDRICATTRKESYVLQYSCLKGIKLSLLNQIEEGSQIIANAINRYRNTDEDEKCDYGRFQLAQALYWLACLRSNDESMKQAISETRLLIEVATKENENTSYIAKLLQHLGECYPFLGEYKLAIEALTKSAQLCPEPITKIFLARAYSSDGRIQEARELLAEIDRTILSDENHFDLATTLEILAVSSQMTPDIENARAELKAGRSKEPYFVQCRDQLLIALSETSPKTEPGKIRRLLNTINRYVILSPKVFGFGINLNKVIEDIEKRTGGTENSDPH